ncbi:unnamed protein product [Pedinophyceae sp. YPF-701]|nr:unnamed protein product [Pedinophyceae sp. YPF-701]
MPQKAQRDDASRFHCPFPGCTRSFAELWRLKVHFRAPPDVRGSGKERGHGRELDRCPKCAEELKPGKHHIGCSASRKNNKRKAEAAAPQPLATSQERSGSAGSTARHDEINDAQLPHFNLDTVPEPLILDAAAHPPRVTNAAPAPRDWSLHPNAEGGFTAIGYPLSSLTHEELERLEGCAPGRPSAARPAYDTPHHLLHGPDDHAHAHGHERAPKRHCPAPYVPRATSGYDYAAAHLHAPATAGPSVLPAPAAAAHAEHDDDPLGFGIESLDDHTLGGLLERYAEPLDKQDKSLPRPSSFGQLLDLIHLQPCE